MIKPKKKIYCIALQDDFGELWLDSEKRPLKFVYANDTEFRSEYYGFLFEEFNLELVEISIIVTDELYDKVSDSMNDVNKLAKLFKKEITKL